MGLWPVKWFIVLTAIESKVHITINFAYDTKTEKWWNPIFSSPVSSATTPWWPTTTEKEYSTPGTTGVWSLIPSCLRNTRLTT